MASAVDSRLAYARLSAVATASRLPTANRGSNNSYTTSWDTTLRKPDAEGSRRRSAALTWPPFAQSFETRQKIATSPQYWGRANPHNRYTLPNFADVGKANLADSVV